MWYKLVKPQLNLHAKFDMYHIYRVRENCNIKVFDMLDTNTDHYILTFVDVSQQSK